MIGSNLLDPIGGLCLSAYIVIEWIKTLLQNFAKRTSASHAPLTLSVWQEGPPGSVHSCAVPCVALQSRA